MDRSTKISDLTIGELMEFLEQEKEMKRRQLIGIDELANYIGCSRSTAQRLKSSGKIDKAIRQTGRCISFDIDLLDKYLKI